MPTNILDISEEQLLSYLEAEGHPRYRADQILKGIYVKLYEDFSEFTNLPKNMREQLDKEFNLRSLRQIDEIRSKIDDTTKYLWQLSDGLKIESVIIYENKRVTFCISSQVGCALDCKFCATGKMGILRNLTAAEIVEQVLQMKKRSVNPPTNIVFMGMGEPMLNYDNVIRAADILSDPYGLCFNRKKITISTSGIIKGIERMANENQPYSLAISLNSVKQEVREQIMPVSRKYPIDQLLQAALYYTQKTDKRVTFEYVLLDGLNSSPEDAKELVRITHKIPSKINAIPCNSDDPLYRPPSDEALLEFDRIVNKSQRTITIRNRKGWEIQAACGQLYTANENKTKIRKQKSTPAK